MTSDSFTQRFETFFVQLKYGFWNIFEFCEMHLQLSIKFLKNFALWSIKPKNIAVIFSSNWNWHQGSLWEGFLWGVFPCESFPWILFEGYHWKCLSCVGFPMRGFLPEKVSSKKVPIKKVSPKNPSLEMVSLKKVSHEKTDNLDSI